MAVGSYAAGSTPMGGGTVGFSILVLLFDEPAELGRDFSFAVQAIGMTSAAIYILARRQPLAWAMLQGSLIGATIGVPLGIFLVAPFVPSLWIKLIFAVLCVGQLIWTLLREKEALGSVGIVVSLVAVLLCLFGFEKLRIWGAILVGEIQRKRGIE